MVKRDMSQLAIYSIEQETETVPFEKLHDIYINKTSEIVYIVKDKKIYGIICMNDVLRDIYTGGGANWNQPKFYDIVGME